MPLEKDAAYNECTKEQEFARADFYRGKLCDDPGNSRLNTIRSGMERIAVATGTDNLECKKRTDQIEGFIGTAHAIATNSALLKTLGVMICVGMSRPSEAIQRNGGSWGLCYNTTAWGLQ